MARLLLGSCEQSVCQCVLFFWRWDAPFFPLFRCSWAPRKTFPPELGFVQSWCPAVIHTMMHTILKPGFLCYQEHFFPPKTAF